MDYTSVIKDTNNVKTIKQLFENKKPIFLEDTRDEGATQSAVDYQLQSIYQYNVATHDVFNTQIRKDKRIKKDSGTKDINGNPELIETSVPVARIGLPLQRLIVERRVGFMLSDPVKTETVFSSESEAEQQLEKIVQRIQNDNKMDYKNKEIARRMMSELECAEIWYFVPNKEPNEDIKGKLTLRAKLLSPLLGDKLYPLFDDTGDMIAFGRGYKIKEDKIEIDHFDVYTSEFEYKYICRENLWSLDSSVTDVDDQGNIRILNPIPNPVKKIMVIYYTQPHPEWSDVQSMIDRLETTSSNHADTNDYFGSPMLKVKGEIGGFSAKGEQGKIIELSGADSDVNYLEWNASPESVKSEKEELKTDIYSMSQTPDISFERMISIGGNISGIALKMMFLDAHMAVKCKEEIFGIGLQRRLNLIKACIGTIIDTSLSKAAQMVQLKPVITPYLPQNVTEMIDNLSVAVTGGIMSKETAVDQNPLVSDSESEILKLQSDATNQLAGQ
jgi:hypothetical protein